MLVRVYFFRSGNGEQIVMNEFIMFLNLCFFLRTKSLFSNLSYKYHQSYHTRHRKENPKLESKHDKLKAKVFESEVDQKWSSLRFHLDPAVTYIFVTRDT